MDGVNGCRMFLNPQTKEFIKIVTKDGLIYYVGGETAEETRSVMNAIEK